ncbi:hypothetical protein WA158_006492 [Blastocystis sp. Blastoise]
MHSFQILLILLCIIGCNSLLSKRDPASLVKASQYWNHKIRGQNIKICVLDTGISRELDKSSIIFSEIKDFTDEGSIYTSLDHGTFISGVIHSHNKKCLGIAPESFLYLFKVYSNNGSTCSQWIVNAIQYSIDIQCNLINISNGSIDFTDNAITTIIKTAVIHNITVVSAAGNSGPIYGSHTHPSELPYVFSVGSLSIPDNCVAHFSSRGMTTRELNEIHIYNKHICRSNNNYKNISLYINPSGRIKPDIVTHGTYIYGLSSSSSCIIHSGTSYSSPIITAVISLLFSLSLSSSSSSSSCIPLFDNLDNIINNNKKDNYCHNSASIRQMLIENTKRITGKSVFEQGSGSLDTSSLRQSYESFLPHVSFYPNSLDYSDKSYFYPLSLQPLYLTSSPLCIYITIINSISISSFITHPPFLETLSLLSSIQITSHGDSTIYPYFGKILICISILSSLSNYNGNIHGNIALTITSNNSPHNYSIPFSVLVIPTPPREKRFLWDYYHNYQDSTPFVASDSLSHNNGEGDIYGDHIYTNYLSIYRYLVENGYYIDILYSPLYTVSLNMYNAIWIVDIEEIIEEEERDILLHSIINEGFNIILFSEWDNHDYLNQLRHYDSYSHKNIQPFYTGNNIQTISSLFSLFNISFSNDIYQGEIIHNHIHIPIHASGSIILPSFSYSPLNYYPYTYIYKTELRNIIKRKRENCILGLIMKSCSSCGKIMIFTDSGIIDDSDSFSSLFLTIPRDFMEFIKHDSIPKSFIPVF